jgi:hypothetical protein
MTVKIDLDNYDEEGNMYYLFEDVSSVHLMGTDLIIYFKDNDIRKPKFIPIRNILKMEVIGR